MPRCPTGDVARRRRSDCPAPIDTVEGHQFPAQSLNFGHFGRIVRKVLLCVKGSGCSRQSDGRRQRTRRSTPVGESPLYYSTPVIRWFLASPGGNESLTGGFRLIADGEFTEENGGWFRQDSRDRGTGGAVQRTGSRRNRVARRRQGADAADFPR